MRMVPSKFQRNIYTVFSKTDRNINISAVAGSGKTTVLLELLKLIPKGKTALFLAFNTSIVEELKQRVESREGVEIMTIHSYGWRRIMSRYGSVKMNPNKSLAKTEKTLKQYPDIPAKKHGYYFYIIPKMLDLMRCNLVDAEVSAVIEMGEHYDLDIEEREAEIAIKVFKLMNSDKSQFDFTDMIYQPVVDSTIRFKKYDYVFCDESQDFSAAQHEIIKRSINRRGRLITVGDSRQAIYGFAGADVESYNKLSELNGSGVTMPLSVSYRCDINIVREAQKVIPEISWGPNAGEGEVKQGSLSEIEYGDWVLCRNLKPLIQTYLWLMKNKIKSKIRGKEIGEGIISLINKIGAKTLDSLDRGLELEKIRLFNKLQSRGVRKPLSHPKTELLNQKIEVIKFLSEEVYNVIQLKKMIEDIFSDEVKGVLLSTIHKAKGLENDKIFFLCPELIPSVYATQPWHFEQEENLRYVAITRAKHSLVYVSGDTFSNDIKDKIVIK